MEQDTHFEQIPIEKIKHIVRAQASTDISITQDKTSKARVKVLLADDAEVIKGPIRRLLSEHAGIMLVGEAATARETIALAKELCPDVVLLDLHFWNKHPAEFRDLRAHLHPGTQLLAMSFSNDEGAKLLAEGLGAAVLLDKVTLGDELIPAILTLGRMNANSASA
jgi:DNA-binding NarL/FixJ family response regulator